MRRTPPRGVISIQVFYRFNLKLDRTFRSVAAASGLRELERQLDPAVVIDLVDAKFVRRGTELRCSGDSKALMPNYEKVSSLVRIF
jgi:hypothetical protein